MEDGLADVHQITSRPPHRLVWTSEEERDTFLDEHARLKTAGESLATLGIPLVVDDGGQQE